MNLQRPPKFTSEPTPDNLRVYFQNIVKDYEHDPEVLHIYMDKALLIVIRSLGYGIAADVFESAERWYA